jgi:glucose/arabinose dehydrogenase
VLSRLFKKSWIFLVLVALSALQASPAFGATLPANFYDSLVNPNANMTNPTAMAIAPDGRIFVCQQGGALRVIKNGALLTTPFMTLTVTSNSERGLLGIAFDPNFSTNRFLYVYYTTTGTIHNRLSRFTADAANPDVVQAGSEVILLDLPNLSAGNHNGGAIHFGPDGRLFVAVGENAVQSNAQSVSTILGKILRINSDGSIPPDNPYYSSPYAGQTVTGQNRLIWALGVRNPFTFNFQPGTGRLFINDVGQNTWEEINDGEPGANYGWPACEGSTCGAITVTVTNPTFFYGSDGTGPSGTECAITGGTFYNPTLAPFPASYVGKYFFADYCGGWIRYLDPPASGVTTGTSTGFATGYNAPVGLEVGPDGALYVLTGANTGTGRVYRIYYSTSPIPVISTHPSPVTVSVGDNASFTVAASGNGPITYLWQRNNVDIAGSNSPSYSLTNAQLVDNGAVFRVIVSNNSGAVTSNGALLTVTTNTPPSPVIVVPTVGFTFNAGQTITFSGTATDAQDGTMGAASFSWRIDLHHETHAHPAMAPTSGVTTGTFAIPNTGETSDNIWYRIYLTVTDSGGLSTTVYREIYPNKTTLILTTAPGGLSITLDGQPFTAPLTFLSVVGMTRSIGTSSPQGANTFASWSDAGAITHNIIAPASNTTYTANFATPTPTRTNTLSPTRTHTPTMTPTFTLTSTPTASMTPTASLTATPSASPTNTSTFTRTSTPTPTRTPTFTATMTSTVTNTLTATPTSTFTHTHSPTSSPTSTATSTATFTPTATQTPTPTATASFTSTATSTATSTFTWTNSFTPTVTATQTSTSTVTNTFTSTDTLTPTATPTPSFTATETPTSTFTVTNSFTPTATFTPTSTVTFTATSTFTPIFTDTPTATPSATPTPSRTSTPTSSPTRTRTPTATSTSTRTPSLTPTRTNSPTPTSTFAASLTATPSATPLLGFCHPFPNPAKGDKVSFCVFIEAPSLVRWTVYTLSYRKIYQGSQTLSSSGIIDWDLKDSWGQPVANGFYYMKVEVAGPTSMAAMLKVLVTR